MHGGGGEATDECEVIGGQVDDRDSDATAKPPTGPNHEPVPLRTRDSLHHDTLAPAIGARTPAAVQTGNRNAKVRRSTVSGRYPCSLSREWSHVDSELTLRDYVQLLRRRLWVVIAIFVAVLTAALVYSALQTPLYRSTARVLINQASAADIFDTQFTQNTSFADRVAANESHSSNRSSFETLRSRDSDSEPASRLRRRLAPMSFRSERSTRTQS